MNDTTLLSQVDDNGEGRALFRLIGDTSGVTAIEYALIAARIAVAGPCSHRACDRPTVAVAAKPLCGIQRSSILSAQVCPFKGRAMSDPRQTDRGWRDE
jgi:hypothetical protein